LEERVLLAATVVPWTGGGANQNFSNPDNGDATLDKRFDNYPGNQNGNDYQIEFGSKLAGAITAHVNVNTQISGIVLDGDVQLTLVFDGNFTIGKNPAGAGSILTFNQAAGKTTSLTHDLNLTTTVNGAIVGGMRGVGGAIWRISYVIECRGNFYG
jgi:hypothetical protein